MKTHQGISSFLSSLHIANIVLYLNKYLSGRYINKLRNTG